MVKDKQTTENGHTYINYMPYIRVPICGSGGFDGEKKRRIFWKDAAEGTVARAGVASFLGAGRLL